jgi:hypothetical protein
VTKKANKDRADKKADKDGHRSSEPSPAQPFQLKEDEPDEHRIKSRNNCHGTSSQWLARKLPGFLSNQGSNGRRDRKI